LTITPSSEQEAADTIASAKGTLSFRGGGTRSVYHGTGADVILQSSGLSGITLYEPSEMVIAAKAGTPLAVVEATLAEKGQRLTFEPMDHRLILGTKGQPTIGSVAACNISGPRRIFAGAARDSMIGIRFINGKGEITRSGGRVMKNVTGLDLVKLQAGAMGRLGFLTEVTFKVLPTPEAASTLLLYGLSNTKAVEAMSRAMGSPFEVNGAAHEPAHGSMPARTFLRIENVASAVDYRFMKLVTLLADFGQVGRVEGEASEQLWRDIRDVVSLANDADSVIWRISAKPSHGPLIVEDIQQHREARAMFDWCGGLIWLATPPHAEGGQMAIDRAIRKHGGHYRLERGPDALKERGIAMAQPSAIAKLEDGIRKSIDPRCIFAQPKAFPYAETTQP
jgi:glycolate oxidase FAD binding subunit